MPITRVEPRAFALRNPLNYLPVDYKRVALWEAGIHFLRPPR